MVSRHRKILTIFTDIIILQVIFLVAIFLLNMVVGSIFGVNTLNRERELNANGGVFVLAPFIVAIATLYGIYRPMTKSKELSY